MGSRTRERTFTATARSWEEAIDRAAQDAVENVWTTADWHWEEPRESSPSVFIVVVGDFERSWRAGSRETTKESCPALSKLPCREVCPWAYGRRPSETRGAGGRGRPPRNAMPPSAA